MDTTKPPPDFPPNSCTPGDLVARLSTRDAPLLIDIRPSEAFIASAYALPGALRRDPAELDIWAASLPASVSIVVHCVHGREVSKAATHALRERGVNAVFLQGGIEAWREQGLGLVAKSTGSASRWVTRERPKIDRIACPWLVRRFIDAQAQFLYVPTQEIGEVARTRKAIPYDVNADVAKTEFTHAGDLCSFDAFIQNYHLGADTALAKLADIVRAADTDRLHLAPQAAGLLAISLGMSRTHSDDQAMLQAMMPVYDALYLWCRDAARGLDESHNWTPPQGGAA